MKIGFSENFCNQKIFFKHFPINPIANWTYGQNIENRATPPLNCEVKKSRRRMGGAERVGWRITSEVRWDQSHLIPLSSHQASKRYFANEPHSSPTFLPPQNQSHRLPPSEPNTVSLPLANTQYVARWDKSGKRKKSGRPPTFFTVPSPVQPPLGLMFDILIFSYQK